MNKSLFIFFLLFIINFTTSYSQTNGYTEEIIDSLKNIVNTSTTDSVTMKAIRKLYLHYSNNDPEQQYFYVKKGLIITERTKDTLRKAKLLTQLAFYHKSNNNLDSSIFYLRKAEGLLLELNDSSSYFKLEYSIANILISEANYEEAIAIYIKGISFHEKLKNEKGQIGALMGRLNLSGLYFSMRDYEKSIEISKQIEKSEIAKTRPQYKRAAWINLTGLYTTINQLDSALVYAKKAEKVVTKKQELFNLNTNFGAIYQIKKQYDKAIAYFYKSLNIANALNNNDGITMSYNSIAKVYLEQEKLDSAELYLLKSKKLLEIKGKLASIENNYESLSSLYNKKGEYKKSLKFKGLQIELRDSILGIEKQQALIDVEKKYQTEKVKREKELVEAREIIAREKAEQSRKLSIGAIVFACIVLFLLIFIFNRLKLIRKQKTELDDAYLRLEESKKYELAASNLKALKSQMNPHFIFNSLNSIQDLILQKDTETSYDYIVLFAELVRNTLNYSNNEFIEFDKEIDFLTVYLELEKLRFGEEFTYSINDQGISGIKVPSLIIQPFLENSLKHGLLHRDGLKTLSIDFELKDNLICTIIDNGVGREESERIQKRRGGKHESFAMNAIQERLNLLGERFEGNFSFEVIDLYDYDVSKGTKIIVRIPFEQEF